MGITRWASEFDSGEELQDYFLSEFGLYVKPDEAAVLVRDAKKGEDVRLSAPYSRRTKRRWLRRGRRKG